MPRVRTFPALLVDHFDEEHDLTTGGVFAGINVTDEDVGHVILLLFSLF